MPRYLPLREDPDRVEEPLEDLTDGRLGADDLVRPKPPLVSVFEGFRVWNLFCDVVGLRNGALILLALLFAFGELTGVLRVDALLRCIVELFTRFEMSRW